MGDKNHRLKCLNSLSELVKHRGTPKKEELLDLFAAYVYMTSPDYRYNGTYLKDKIPKFCSNLDIYISKVNFREEVLREIQKHQIPKSGNCQLSIQIDETWELRFDNMSKEAASEWRRLISEMPKLNSVDSKKTYIKCQFNSSHGDAFSDYLVSEDKEDLKRFIADSIKSFIKRLEA